MIKVLNKKLKEELIPRLLKDYHCTSYRILLPDSMFTQDYDKNRLNIFIDIHRNILNVYSG